MKLPFCSSKYFQNIIKQNKIKKKKKKKKQSDTDTFFPPKQREFSESQSNLISVKEMETYSRSHLWNQE